MSRAVRILVAAAALLVVAEGIATPARAADPGSAAASALVGDFGLGDGLEGGIDQQTGGFSFAASAGGVPLVWDSARVGIDRYGLGDGWTLRTAFVDTDGGVRVFPAIGGVFEADASSPSGLLGYPTDDLVFEALPGGRIPEREGQGAGAAHDVAGGGGAGDGSGEREVAYVLRELGGVSTYFDAAGDPVARITATGQRTDWLWSAEVRHRLLGIVTPDGVRTELEWDDDRGEIRVRPAVNVAGRAGGARVDDENPDWRVALRDGRVAAVIDPLGGRLAATSDSSGLVTALESPSGATTEIQWRAAADGAAQVDHVALTDATGELSRREFEMSTPPSGWPMHGTAAGAFGAGDATSTTELTDGSTRVISTSNSLGLLVSRRIVVTTPSGDQTLQEHRFAYRGTDEDGHPAAPSAALPPAWASPTATTVTHHDAGGATREARQTATFDEFGRPIEVIAADDSRTVTEYDRATPPSAELAIGLPIKRTTVAPDGWTSETRFELNPARTAPLATEQYAAAPGEPLARVARSEFEVEPDGFVAERRVYPDGDPQRPPLVSTWQKHVDLAAGTATLTAVLAAGSAAQTTTSSVSSLVHGGVLQTTDPIGRTATAEYDELGRVRTATDGAGRVTTTTYATAQREGRNAITVTTPDGVTTTEEHDTLGRVVRVTDNVHGGQVETGHSRVRETREYPDAATVRVTDAHGATTTMRQDVFGRTVETIGPDGLRRLVAHDDVAMSTSAGVTPTATLADAELVGTEQRDVAGRVVHAESARADGEPAPETHVAYDGLGRVVSSGDTVASSTMHYDRFGNPVRTSIAAADGAGVVAESRFDGFGTGLEKTLTDGSGAAPRSSGTRGLDPLGRATELRDQLGRVTSAEYTVDGLPAVVTGPAGETTAYRYDPRTRQVVEAVATNPAGGRVATAYEYDDATGRVTAIFDPADPAASRIEYETDVDGNLTATRFPDGRTLTHAYDDHGRKTSTTDVAGTVTEYRYDELGRLSGARQTGRVEGDGVGELLAEVRYGYDDHGRLAEIDRGNGVRTTIELDSAGLVSAERTTGHGEPIAERDYQYDVHGNVTRRTDTTHESGATTSTTTVYRYDGLDRLIQSTVHSGMTPEAPVERRTEYRVTASADVANETVTERPGAPDEVVTAQAYTYNPLGELTDLAITRGGETEHRAQEYDQAGNLVLGHDGSRYVYDAANRVVSQTTPEGATIATEYWADGARKRRSTTAPGSTESQATTTYWDGGVLVNETHTGSVAASDAGTASYLLGLRREARTSVDDDARRLTRYAVTDRHGSVTELTDELGATTDRFTYTDYGEDSSAAAAPIAGSSTSSSAMAGIGDLTYQAVRFAGELTDGDGTQYLRARVYDPATKRFHTKDLADRLNLYHFADVNPIVKLDPSGREPVLDFALALAGYVLTIGALAAVPFSGGSTLAMVGALAAAGADAAIATLTVVDQRAVDVIPDDWALGLAITSAVIGVVSAAASFADLAVSRLARRGAARGRISSVADESSGSSPGSIGRAAERSSPPPPASPPPSEGAHIPPETSVWREPPSPTQTQTFVPDEVETKLPVPTSDPAPDPNVFLTSHAYVSPLPLPTPTPSTSPNWSPVVSRRQSEVSITPPLEPPDAITQSSQQSARAAQTAAVPQGSPTDVPSIVDRTQGLLADTQTYVSTTLAGYVDTAQHAVGTARQTVTGAFDYLGGLTDSWSTSWTRFLDTQVHELPDPPLNLGRSAQTLIGI